MAFLDKLFGSFSDKELKKIRPIADKVIALESEMAAKTDAELQAMTPALKERLANGETLDDILPEAFAVCREASWRVLGMKHFPVQIIGGIVLHRACIAEMQTGEGKTLVATLPVYLNALAGKGVHVVTVNDYLARRDSEWMGKLYRWLGLKVGLIVQGITNEQRHAAYNADITYGTNNEFGFDYLRDNMVVYKENMVQRGHFFAIVDEVDSILIDEARTPLIISGKGDDSSDLYQQADAFAKTLKMSKIVELDDKEDQDAQVDGDYVVDEKHKTATLTQSGVKKAEAYFHVENLSDAANMTLAHHINQAIKARGVMQRDIDYVVRDGEVIIVDEFTGRLMIGRRYNEGLHQAIEAKEGVKVAAESKTLATITFQNYFRMYEKLAGMTGTAKTEADEFIEIYGLQIVTVPTNKPQLRKDEPDSVYKTVKGKYDAVVKQVAECHAKGQPVLVGTVSIEKSETLSKLLSRQGIKHNVLNAKNHEKEAEIVAQAGKKGAVTIATNMAGRGTDIMLGGNAEYMAKAQLRKEGFAEELIVEADGHGETDNEEILAARARFDELLAAHKAEIAKEAEEVRAAGGLYIIGTERHESRRIDNQLRGRSGRQGDPGASRFFLSLEDDLMRLFGGERVQSLMDTLGLDDETPIENKMITNTIESAQKKLEAQNFSTRKNVLQFDDVMNKQREIIYGQRRQVLNGEDLKDTLRSMMKDNIEGSVATFCAGDDSSAWDLAALRRHYLGWLTMDSDLHYEEDQLKSLKREDVSKFLLDRGTLILDGKEKKYGSNIMRELERMCLLRNVDTKWMDHIDAMDQLRQGIYLRSYGQRDPVVEYRLEGFEMFDSMIDSIKEDTVRMLLTIELKIQPQQAPVVERTQVAKPTGDAATPGKNVKATSSSGPVKVEKIGRNDPCPCGSGLKWKKCTCKEYHPDL
ncbi:preprotein translocase subunit SecA [Fournierella sp.]|uniref:preprotein translocase subunit SecA n=1 Tax=Allofournierella sp. TaxID=1940256 RepID=UPI0025BEC12C|nr:preprotein translocase subunit SecA [Fournierella sp.]